MKNTVHRKLASAYVLLIATVFLLFPGTKGYVHITRDKFVLFLSLSGIYIAANLVWALLRRMRGEAIGRIRFSWTERMVLAYMLLTAVSAVLSPYFPRTLVGVSRYEGAVTILTYGAVFLLLARHLRVQRWMIYALGAAAVPFCALCFVQMTGANPLGLYPGSYTYFDGGVKYTGRFLGTIGNTGLVAAFLCLLIPLLLIYVLKDRRKLRFLLLVPLAMAAVLLALIDIAAGFVGAAAALAMAAVLCAKNRRRAFVILVLCLCACAAIVYFTEPGGVLGEAGRMLHGDFDPKLGSGRLHIWSQVLGKIPDRPLFGYGPDTMRAVGLEGFSRYDEATGKMVRTAIDVAHNEYLNILFHQGALALASFLAMLATLIVRSARRGGDMVLIMCTAAVIGWCVQGLFGYSICITAPFFWCTAAAVEARMRQIAAPHCSDEPC